jgi:thiamine-phosphate pyrophosphorylase
MIKKAIDYSLYLVTDRKLSMGRHNLSVVQSAVKGGVSCVQLREKNCSTFEFIEQALLLKDFLNEQNIMLIINDNLDVAQAVGADGIHLGQKDTPFSMAKKIVGNSMIIGISAECLNDAVRAEKEGADYIGVGPIYSTATKTDTGAPLGLEGLRQIRKSVKIPIVAIGGLNPTNAEEVIKSGADGIAVVSAIVSAKDPEKEARTLITIITKAKQDGSKRNWGIRAYQKAV